MASIVLKNVCVEHPVYHGVERSLKRALANLTVGGAIKRAKGSHIIVKALDDISLEIRSGDKIGIIGRNGAGKTSLLRVMAGINEPVSGTCAVDGRVSSLFSAAGFLDPEMNGYENIEYAAGLLGFTGRQTKRVVADLEVFTELGEYLSLPLRTYSAGMQVRLAFGLITSIDPEILIMDEAIGAGDFHFIERARGRFRNFCKRAEIIVIASHDLGMLHSMCDKVVWLEHGQLSRLGEAGEMIDLYKKAI